MAPVPCKWKDKDNMTALFSKINDFEKLPKNIGKLLNVFLSAFITYIYPSMIKCIFIYFKCFKFQDRVRGRDR